MAVQTTVPMAHTSKMSCVETRVMSIPPSTRPVMKSSSPPIDSAHVACVGVMKPSSVMKLMKNVLIEISEIS